MNPDWSRRFIQRLIQVAILWLGVGIAFTFSDLPAMSAFFQVYFATLMDLTFILLIFWSVFFSQSTQRAKAIRSIIFFTFKLVCLGFLAITLKRLRNAPTYSLVLGVLFIGLGPMAAGVLSRIQKGNSKRAANDNREL